MDHFLRSLSSGIFLSIVVAVAASGASAQIATLHPQPLATELSNPHQGLYTWLNANMAQRQQPSLDRYQRFAWAQLEPKEGQYDFSAIDQNLASLPPGTRFAFRVMAMNSNWSVKDGSDVPDYLMQHMQRGFYLPLSQPNPKYPNGLYVPDWNDSYFLDRLDRLFAALGKRYDGDPRISWVDIGIFGNWGEWHVFVPGTGNVPYQNSSVNRNGATPASLQTRQRMVDAHANAFRKTRLVMLTADIDALAYALRLQRAVPIGMRRDSFGSVLFDHDFVPSNVSDADRQLISDRWKTAPLIVESFGGAKAFEVGLPGLVQQVRKFHIAAIGNGGFANQLTPDQQQAILAAGMASGYRFWVKGVDVSLAQANGGQALQLSTAWQNDGVTPAYQPWQVKFLLYQAGSSTPVAQATSQVDLQRVLPTGSQPVTVQDSLTLASAANGQYELRVQIVDPAGYGLPMQLAEQGRNADGSYTLGRFNLPQ